MGFFVVGGVTARYRLTPDGLIGGAHGSIANDSKSHSRLIHDARIHVCYLEFCHGCWFEMDFVILICVIFGQLTHTKTLQLLCFVHIILKMRRYVLRPEASGLLQSHNLKCPKYSESKARLLASKLLSCIVSDFEKYEQRNFKSCFRMCTWEANIVFWHLLETAIIRTPQALYKYHWKCSSIPEKASLGSSQPLNAFEYDLSKKRKPGFLFLRLP